MFSPRSPKRSSARIAALAALPPTAVLALAALLALVLLTAPASAAPTLTIKTRALPIPGFPHTGNILGAGALVVGEGTLSGTEYAGSPPPLTQIKVFAPAGARLHPEGFATCPPEALERTGPEACSKQSVAGPKTSALGVVSFASERVPETVSVQPFFAPGGGLEGFVKGATPVSVEILVKARFTNAAPPFGFEGVAEVPLIETLPGAPDASFLHGSVGVGAAYRKNGKTISYLTLPKTCSKGGWPLKVQMTFYGGATAEASYEMPCPKA
jgi:hypothetical protein